jgi:hypothetical protein
MDTFKADMPVKLNASAAINYNYNHMPDDLYVQAVTYNLSLQKVFYPPDGEFTSMPNNAWSYHWQIMAAIHANISCSV